jgi:hypothetical protein
MFFADLGGRRLPQQFDLTGDVNGMMLAAMTEISEFILNYVVMPILMVLMPLFRFVWYLSKRIGSGVAELFVNHISRAIYAALCIALLGVLLSHF